MSSFIPPPFKKLQIHPRSVGHCLRFKGPRKKTNRSKNFGGCVFENVVLPLRDDKNSQGRPSRLYTKSLLLEINRAELSLPTRAQCVLHVDIL